MAASRDLVLRLVSDVSQFGRGFTRAEREASQFSKNVARAFGASGKDIDSRARAIDASLRSAVGGFTAFAAGATGAVLAVRKLGEFGAEAISAFSDLQESANAVNVVFGESARTIEEFGENSAQAVGLARSEFLELAARVGGQLQNLGFSTREAADQTLALTERAADLASVYGGTVADALGAISAALRGERDPIERYAITLNDANVSARALADGLAETKGEIDATDKAAASLSLIFEQSDKVAGDFANTADDVANKQRVLAAEFENAKAVIGEALLPAYQAGIDLIPIFIETIENLAPAVERASQALADNADEAAGFVERLPALAASGFDFIGFLGNLKDGAGEAASAVRNLAEFNINLGLGNIGEDTTREFDQLKENLSEINRLAQEAERNQAFGSLNRAIAGGIEPISAYATVLRDLGRDGEIAQETIRDLGTVAGLSNAEQQRAILTLLNQADALGITEQGAEDLAGAYTDLIYAQQQLSRQADQDTIDRGLGDAAGRIFRPGVVAGLNEAAERELVELDETLRNKLSDAADTAQAGVEGLVSRISELRADFASEIDLFNQIELTPSDSLQSPGDILGNLEQQAEILGRFGDAISTLAAEGLTSLVGELVAAGPSVVGEAEALAGDIETAFEIDEQLRTNMQLATDAAFATLSPAQNQDKAGEANELGRFIAANVNIGFNEALNFGPGLSRALSGATAPSTAVGLGARAYGGDVDAGRTYIVGENGPELFTPPVAGRIQPDLGSAGSTTFNFNPTVVGSGNVARDLDTQRHLLLASVGRMVEGMA